MSRRNVNRDALQRQAERINRAPAGQADAARSAARANRARQRGCTSPGPQDSRRVARADRESTRRLRSRRQSSGSAMQSRIAIDVRGRSDTRVRAQGCRACAQWLRVWRRTRGQYSAIRLLLILHSSQSLLDHVHNLVARIAHLAVRKFEQSPSCLVIEGHSQPNHCLPPSSPQI